MKTSSVFLKTGITYFLWALGSPLFVVMLWSNSLLPASLRYDNRIYHFIAKLWARFLVKSSFVRFSVKGLEHVPNYPNQPSLILINHASMLDIPLVEMLFKHYPRIWLCNDYRRIPFFGTLLSRMHIVVQRNDVAQLVGAIRKAYALTKDKQRHLFMFPEGTRHHDGNIHDFYGGFAILAEKLKRPVIPVVLCGLHKILPKGSLVIDSSACQVKISIGKPINYADFASRQDFINAVQDRFKKELEQLKKE